MIIGIDISSVSYQTGVSNYTLNLIKNLLKIDQKNQYKFFYSSLRLPLLPEARKIIDSSSNASLYEFKIPPTILQIIWNRLRLFPIELFIGQCDLFHTSDWTQPPTIKAKTITTIHDLTPFLFPQWHHQKVIKAHKNKMYWAAKRCVSFICVSQNTKQDLLKLFPQIDPKKTTVIYEAAEEKFSHFFQLSSLQQKTEKTKIEKKYKINNFILAQGTREPRKNLDRLIRAFTDFKKKNPKDLTQLAITGKYGWGKDIKDNYSDIKILGFIPEKDLVAIHASALCLAYPSLYEGFGLPIIKSLQVGVPVITSNNSSLIEIAKGSAILVNPKSVKEISQAIEKIIKQPTLRQKLSQKGIELAKKFNWIKTAQETLEVYKKI